MLSSFVEKSQRDWDVLLPYMLFAYRTSVHESTKDTPFFLMFGRDPITPLDRSLLPHVNMHWIDDPNFKQIMMHRLEKAWTQSRDNIETTQANFTKYHKVNPVGYQKGDLVRIYFPVVKQGKTLKLSRLWKGPYRVLKVMDSNLLLQSLIKPENLQLIHKNRCKLINVSKSSTPSVPRGNKNKRFNKKIAEHGYKLRPRRC